MSRTYWELLLSLCRKAIRNIQITKVGQETLELIRQQVNLLIMLETLYLTACSSHEAP